MCERERETHPKLLHRILFVWAYFVLFASQYISQRRSSDFCCDVILFSTFSLFFRWCRSLFFSLLRTFWSLFFSFILFVTKKTRRLLMFYLYIFLSFIFLLQTPVNSRCDSVSHLRTKATVPRDASLCERNEKQRNKKKTK